MREIKFIAYYSAGNETELFETFEEAKKWLENLWDEDLGDEGYAEETINGEDYIARITHISNFTVTGDKKKQNYLWNDEAAASFIDGDENKDQWPVAESLDFYGELKLKEVI